MTVTPFRKINTKDKDLMRLQDAVADTFSAIVRNPFLNGNFVDVSLTTAVTQVPHGLGRKVEGWFVTRKNAQSDVWEPSQSETPTKTLQLQASATVTVTVFFF